MSRDDDSANTAMFRAFVDDDTPQQDQGQDRAKLLILAAVVLVVIAAGCLFALS